MAYSESEIQEVKSIIIQKVSRGDSLKRIIEEDKRCPSRATVYKWLNPSCEEYDSEFFNNYIRAREERADAIFDEMIDIADDGRNDYMTIVKGGNEIEVVNHENINRSRLRVDTRKWILSRMDPKKYGDKIDHTSAGEKITQNIISLGSGKKPESDS